jgi:hypothetical protein
MYYVAALGSASLGLAALRPAATSTTAAAMSVFVPCFLFRILPLFTLNLLSLFKNFFEILIVYMY